MPYSRRDIEALLDRATIADAARLRARLIRLRSDDRGTEAAIDAIGVEAERSGARREERARRAPTVTYPNDLPIVAKKDEIARAIEGHRVVVVAGETGSGKSTQLPKICLEMGRGVAGRIAHTQPRRIAARTIAARIAEELSVPVGREVGYKVRFADRTDSEAYLTVLTDGMLLAETQSDRFLNRYDTIIVDEAHERSLNIDFLLGYLHRLLNRRPELKLIITSATIDPARFSEHFGGPERAPVIEVSGRTHPVEVRYRPLETSDEDEADLTVLEGVARAVDELTGVDPAGDVLIFMPGEREIRESARMLRKHLPANTTTELLPLYARLSPAEQQRVFQPHSNRRIVIATNVAETSVTVPGVKFVIDPGLARIGRYSQRGRVQRLPIEEISQASAEQRKGRCGRVSEGVCVRLYSEENFLGREEFTPPEIVRTNLASVILRMKAMGLGNVERFPFLDRPKAAAVREGERTLVELGALEEAGRLTKVGKRLARLPIDPRLGRMILAGERERSLREVLVIAAGLTVADPRLRSQETASAADAAHREFEAEGSDFLTLLNLWRAYHEAKEANSRRGLRAWCKQRHLSYLRFLEWTDLHRQLRSLAKEMRLRVNEKPAKESAVHRAILAGLLSHVGVKRGDWEYEGPYDRTFAIHPGSVLFRSKPRWLMAAELVETTRLYARTNASIRPTWIERAAGPLLKRSYRDPYWHRKSARVMAFETTRLFGLEITSGRRVHYGPAAPEEAREIFIEEALVNGTYNVEAPFLKHNRSLEREIEREEAKLRRRDLLVDRKARFAFYDRRVPADVYTGEHFERWRLKAEGDHPHLLFMSPEDLRRPDTVAPEAGAFPERLALDGVKVPLSYKFEPGAADDGVTARVPVEGVSHLDAAAAEWLVPGLLPEKITALLRALPKTYRRRIVPIPDFARAAHDWLRARPRWRERPLVDALRAAMKDLANLSIPADAWADADLPDHLRLNVHVLDAGGGVLATGRDLDALKSTLHEKATEHLRDAGGEEFDRTGLRTWEFGELPGSVRIRRRGVDVDAFPALVDEGETVGVRLFTTRGEAEASHRAGLRRLARLAASRDLAFDLDHLPGMTAAALRYAARGEGTPLVEVVRLLTAERACVGEDANVRTRDEFRRRVEAGRRDVWRHALEVANLLAAILERSHEIRLALENPTPEAWSASVADVRAQLAALTPKGFLLDTPRERLDEFPRYLRGMRVRLDRLKSGGHRRDADRLRDAVRPLAEALAEAREHAPPEEAPRVDRARWLLEEYRLVVFAPDVGGTPPRVEARLREALAALDVSRSAIS